MCLLLAMKRQVQYEYKQANNLINYCDYLEIKKFKRKQAINKINKSTVTSAGMEIILCLSRMRYVSSAKNRCYSWFEKYVA